MDFLLLRVKSLLSSKNISLKSKETNQSIEKRKMKEEEIEAKLTLPYGGNVSGGLTQRRNPSGILQKWADETIAATEGNEALKDVMNSKAYDKPLMERPIWKDPPGFLKGCNKHTKDWYGPTKKVGDIIGLSALYADVDDDGERKKDLVDSASRFMLNVGIIATLLVGFQLGLIASEVPVHPMVVEGVHYLEKKFWGEPIWIGSKEDLQHDLVIIILQQISAICLVLSIRDMIAFIVKSNKMYSALMYWCVDFETRVWFSRTWCIQEAEGKIKVLIRGFCRSLIPYIFLSRGPIIAICMELMQRSIIHRLKILVEIAQRIITYRLARKAKDVKKTNVHEDVSSIYIDPSLEA